MLTRRPRGRILLVVLAVAARLRAPGHGHRAYAPLPACAVADTLTAHRKLADWPRSLLDTTYRLSSTYAPTDLRSTSTAGLNGGIKVRSWSSPISGDGRGRASKAGARFSVQSAYRSYATQRSTFAYWVTLHGLCIRADRERPRRPQRAPAGTTLDFRSYGGAAPWDLLGLGQHQGRDVAPQERLEVRLRDELPEGQDAVTCYMYEPWHFRYVGRANAKRVHDSGLTLREYLWRRQTAGTPTATPTPTPTPEPTPTPTPTPVPTPVG